MRRNKYQELTEKEFQKKNREGLTLMELTLVYPVLYTHPTRYKRRYEIKEIDTSDSNFRIAKRKCNKSWRYYLVFPGVSYEVRDLYTDRENVKKCFKLQLKKSLKWQLGYLNTLQKSIARYPKKLARINSL